MLRMRSFERAGPSRAVSSTAFWLALCVATAGAQKAVPRTHLDWARTLVRELRPEDTSYQHKPAYVKWKGEGGARAYESHTDCSGFLTALLEHSYGFDQAHFERWLNTRRPLAIDYHEAILRQRGFKQIQRMTGVLPGDVIAIKYPPDAENSGHIMLVGETPRRIKSIRPEIEGTEQWEVEVIDSSRSGHGKTDTRRRDDGTFGSGVGEGVFRIYTNRDGTLAGYSWSTFANSDYYDLNQRHLLIGRLDLQSRP